MLTLINIELFKIFSKWRTYIGFIAIGLLFPIIHYSFYAAGSKAATGAMRSLGDQFVFAGNLINGYFVANFLLMTMFVHIPFLIVLVGGDLLAGEATGGTYRMLVTRPVSRFQIVTSKFIAGIIYTALLVCFLALMSLGLGLLLFGSGPLIAYKSQIIVFAPGDILWRFMCAYLVAILNMSVVTALAFLFSSFVSNAIGPIVSTMAVMIVFLIASAIPIDFFEAIKPYLFTNYFGGWSSFFDDPIDKGKIVRDSLVLLGHIAGFYAIALYIFSKKDILS